MYGKISNTQIVICYLKSVANSKLVKEVKYRVNNIGVDYLISSGQLEQLIEDTNYSLPQVIASERPDRMASLILEGRVVIIVNRNTLRTCSTRSINRFSIDCWGQKFKIPICKFTKSNKANSFLHYNTTPRFIYCNYNVPSRTNSNRTTLCNSCIKKQCTISNNIWNYAYGDISWINQRIRN